MTVSLAAAAVALLLSLPGGSQEERCAPVLADGAQHEGELHGGDPWRVDVAVALLTFGGI